MQCYLKYHYMDPPFLCAEKTSTFKTNFRKNWFVSFPLGFCSLQTVSLMKLKSIKWFTSLFVLQASALSQTVNVRRLTKALMRKYWQILEQHGVGLWSSFSFMLLFPPRQSNTKWHVAVSNCCEWEIEEDSFNPGLKFLDRVVEANGKNTNHG